MWAAEPVVETVAADWRRSFKPAPEFGPGGRDPSAEWRLP